MLITDLALSIQESLNSTPESWDLELGLEAVVAIDWVVVLNQSGIKVILSPELNQYNIEASPGRGGRKININVTKYVHLIIGKNFESLADTNDIAPWDELKQLLDIRELIELFMIRNQPLGVQLTSVEAQPVDEQQLDYRNFNTITSFGYEASECG
jgi:hypothetical protein